VNTRAIVVPTTLDQAIGDEVNVWTTAAQMRIRTRLQLAADGEWASRALIAFDRDRDGFLRRHFDSDLEQSRTAVALYRAAVEVCERTGTSTLDEALIQLGISEEQWLREVGLVVVDQSKEDT
jgi:hypothetical protein